MGYARIPGNLTALEVRMLFRVRDFTSENGYPPIIKDLCLINGKKLSYANIWREVYQLEKWGYLACVKTSPKNLFWVLTEKGKDLVNGGDKSNVQVTGLGEVR
jgi:hypothetical protein